MPFANPMPTVDEILAQQGRVLAQQSRPGLPALPGPLASPADANLGLVGNVLSRVLSRPASDVPTPLQPAAPAAAAPLDPRNVPIVAPPAPRPAPPVPHASPQTVAIHRSERDAAEQDHRRPVLASTRCGGSTRSPPRTFCMKPRRTSSWMSRENCSRSSMPAGPAPPLMPAESD